VEAAFLPPNGQGLGRAQSARARTDHVHTFFSKQTHQRSLLPGFLKPRRFSISGFWSTDGRVWQNRKESRAAAGTVGSGFWRPAEVSTARLISIRFHRGLSVAGNSPSANSFLIPNPPQQTDSVALSLRGDWKTRTQPRCALVNDFKQQPHFRFGYRNRP